MASNTRKFSGPALDRYLKRFFAAQPGMSSETAETLARHASAAFSSIRVRPGFEPIPTTQRATATVRPAAATPAPAPAMPPAAPAAKPAAGAPISTSDEFDAFAIGLVPTFQREGRDGLIAKLGAISSLDNLRKTARAQQIVLPEAMRQGDVAIETLRAAIADAVAKRIADRRAAAG